MGCNKRSPQSAAGLGELREVAARGGVVLSGRKVVVKRRKPSLDLGFGFWIYGYRGVCLGMLRGRYRVGRKLTSS